MQEREPEALLSSLLQSLGRKGVGIQHALFVPPDSMYSKATKGGCLEQMDLRWQSTLRNKWEAVNASSNGYHAQALPPTLQPTAKISHPLLSAVAKLNFQLWRRRGGGGVLEATLNSQFVACSTA
jgi:hypothetical protein